MDLSNISGENISYFQNSFIHFSLRENATLYLST